MNSYIFIIYVPDFNVLLDFPYRSLTFPPITRENDNNLVFASILFRTAEFVNLFRNLTLSHDFVFVFCYYFNSEVRVF